MDGSTAIGGPAEDFGGFESLWWLEDGREYDSADEWPEWCDSVRVATGPATAEGGRR